MERDDNLNSEPVVDYEAEMARAVDSVDNVIFPGLLEMLNKAKIDYNVAASRYTDNYTRNILAEKYAELLTRTGSILGVRATIIREICITRPKLLVALDHAARLTIEWLELIVQTQVCSHEPNFIIWANTQILNERLFLNEIGLATEESDGVKFTERNRRQ